MSCSVRLALAGLLCGAVLSGTVVGGSPSWRGEKAGVGSSKATDKDANAKSKAPAPKDPGADAGDAAVDVKPSRMKTHKFADLERLAAKQDTLQAILVCYKLFLDDPDVSPSEKTLAKKRLPHWQALAKAGAVRMGQKWMTPEQLKELEDQESQLLVEAWHLMDVGDGKGAEQKLLSASRVNPNGIRADFLLGLANALGLRLADQAEKHFRECVKRRIAHPDLLNNRERANLVASLNNVALAEIRQKKYESAFRHWKIATEQAPPSTQLIQNLGRLVFLAKNASHLGIPKATSSAASKLYIKLASAKETQKFNPHTGWLYLPIFSPVEDEPENVEPKKAEPKTPADSNKRSPLADDEYIVVGSASGFAVAPGYFITNRHVVQEADRLVICNQANLNTPEVATVVDFSLEHDLALIKCDKLNLPAIPLAQQLPRLATDITVLGYPNTTVLGTTLKVSRGSIVGHPNKQVDNQLLYDAVTNPGNSGGPVANQAGIAVAVHASGLGAAAFEDLNAGKIASGVPSNVAFDFVKQHVPTVEPAQPKQPTREWPDVVEELGNSTIFIRIQMKPTRILVLLAALAPAQKKEKEQDFAFEDPWCMYCYGRGTVPCRACARGSVLVDRSQIIGVDPTTKSAIIETTPTETSCKVCNGRGKLRCPHCHNGFDPSVGGRR